MQSRPLSGLRSECAASTTVSKTSRPRMPACTRTIIVERRAAIALQKSATSKRARQLAQSSLLAASKGVHARCHTVQHLAHNLTWCLLDNLGVLYCGLDLPGAPFRASPWLRSLLAAGFGAARAVAFDAVLGIGFGAALGAALGGALGGASGGALGATLGGALGRALSGTLGVAFSAGLATPFGATCTAGFPAVSLGAACAGSLATTGMVAGGGTFA